VPEPSVPTTFVRASGPRRAAIDAIVWLRAELSQPVESSTVTVLEQRGDRPATVARRLVSGKNVFVPVRLRGPNRGHTFRLRIDNLNVSTVSEPIRVVAERPADRLVATTHPPSALAAGGRVLWELGPPTLSGDTVLIERDARSGRPIRPPVRVPNAISLAASSKRAWLLSVTSVTSVSARSGRPSVPIPLRLGTFDSVGSIAADEDGAWIWVQQASPPKHYLARIDLRRHRVTRRITVPPNSRLDGVGPILTLDRGIANLAVKDGSGSRTWRVDLTTEQVTSSRGLWIGGLGTLWRFDERATRVAPPARRRRGSPGSVGKGVGFDDSFGQYAVSPSQAWVITEGPSQPRSRVTYFSSGNESGRLLRAGPTDQVTPRAARTEQPIAAVDGGVWISIPEYGVLARVASSRAQGP
jgi:hypothetical protein